MATTGPNEFKKIVCLATSRKPGGRCVAGKEALADGYGTWIRPVSSRPSAEIELTERQYEDGTEPKLLDIIRIPMIGAMPRVHQTENRMIDAAYYWKKTGTVAWDDLDELLDAPTALWVNKDSTYHGLYDRVSNADAVALQNSLILIQPEEVTIHVLTPGANFGNYKRAVRAAFQYRGISYNFMVTDPIIEQRFLAGENGEYTLDQDAFFCISLAESHTDGYCYKLVASIITE